MFLSLTYLNSAQHNLVIELCRAQKHFKIFPQLFSKFTYSFVAIELLAKKNSKIPFLLRKRALGIWAFKKTYVERIDFFAFCIKRLAKKSFLYECK